MTTKFDHLVDGEADGLRKVFSEKHRNILATTEVFKNSLLNSNSRGWHTHARLWNIGIFINIASLDLSVLILQLSLERDAWTRKLVARHAALLVYETAEDMTQLLGKNIREPLKTLGLLDKFDIDIRSARQPLDQFWKKNSSKLHYFRTNAVAHRDQDGLKLLEAIEKIDINDVISLGFELGKIMNSLGQLIQRILDESSNIRPPEMNT